MRPMSVYGDLGKNHDPGGSQRKPLTDQPRSKNRYTRHLRELDRLGEDLAVLDREIAEATVGDPAVRVCSRLLA
jgi:transposase